MPSRLGLLDRVEQYAAAAPLADARVVAAGPLDVPIGPSAWPYPARPRPGTGSVSADDVRAAVALQEEAGLPAAVEWVGERTPSLAAAARAAGLVVTDFPLLVVADPVELVLPVGVRLYLVGGEDPRLPHYQHLLETAFAPHAEEAGDDGDPRADGGGAPAEDARTAVLRERVATGRTVLMVAIEDGRPIAVGSHHPVDVGGSEVSEVVGVATSPRRRGRGVGAALASALVAQARETADLVFLTAGDDDVARIYERVGFAQVGTTGVADRLPPVC
ncbi:GNAT superfamily N-acetyltransferase [Geodermatophilus bullaregiensis]|uniref:GNAT family N-acetyltransferase n=1 Tax=Geodermatophilus bullaregiensis TaxID=1564160 RepID=UPI00195BD289|nr:GNAT family N-acetyltransferase [Geodermatophilus bullaregiensis]MBM7804313.1 GNAT superfamily N-acetyltransferase [Geodermatophilus bullaregiensis]